jgi:polysaccharide export outer membrane protein
MRKLCILTIALLLYPGYLMLFAQEHNAAPERHVSSPVAGGGPQGKASDGVEAASYIIGPEDILDISVWREPNVSRAVPVRLDGNISLPLLNDIQAAGFTPMQLAAVITEKLKAFLTKPQVTVTVTAINSQTVFAVGELGHPGPIRLLPHMTVLQAISSAGGLTQFANQKHAYVLRHEDGKDIHYPFNYRDLLRGNMRGNIVLKSGDTIVVP